MTKRTLVLRRELLADLTAEELGAVAGGRPKNPSEDCPGFTEYCLTGPFWCGWAGTLLECV